MNESFARCWRRSWRNGSLLASAAVSGCIAAHVVSTPVISRGVAGIVYDSLAHTALKGATVQFVDAEHPQARPVSLQTNERGEYAAENLPPGRYLATFYHHALDSLGLRANATMVDVTRGGAWLPLSIPSAEHLRTIECGAKAITDSAGVMVGRVFDATSHTVAPDADVSARWSEIDFTRGRGVTARPVSTAAHTTDEGWFVLCGVPPNVEVTLLAARRDDRTGAVAVRVPPNGVAQHDLFIGGPVRVAIRGNVVGSNGGPIPHAHVSIDGGDDLAADDNGVFTVVAGRAGTQTLVTRAIGFFPDERPVNVIPDSVQWVEITLPTIMSVLDTVKINGKRIRDMDNGFEARRSAGIGSFFTASDLTAMSIRSVTEILEHSARTPMVRMANGKLGVRIRGEPCLPVLYLNGMGLPVLEDIDELNHLVDLEDIKSMEIYTPAEAPREFERRNQCAVIVVWTRH
ncbi:MAG TPA: carboxypeptidase-like regulatory domain-containing protein [Gemmatimonadaceae bacterium]|nr:carboxypeptidase-like regulatory domain-containing protein [Gemmatimonadaceae bacterium]